MKLGVSTRTLCGVALPLAIASLTSCEKPIPNGQSGSIALLRAGSDQVCVAPDVQKLLREAILPKSDSFNSDVTPAQVRDALGAIALSFEATTLQSTDKAVTKAVCSTTLKITGFTGEKRQFRLTYDVSPSAENPNAVVVSTDADDAHDFASAEVGNAAAHQNAARAQEAEADEQAKAEQRLRATITPRWLVGTWVKSPDVSSACQGGKGLLLRRDHSFRSPTATGQWSLDGTNLRMIGSSPSGSFDFRFVITAADAISFTFEGDDSGTFRRCSKEDLIRSSDANSPEQIDNMEVPE